MAARDRLERQAGHREAVADDLCSGAPEIDHPGCAVDLTELHGHDVLALRSDGRAQRFDLGLGGGELLAQRLELRLAVLDGGAQGARSTALTKRKARKGRKPIRGRSPFRLSDGVSGRLGWRRLQDGS